MSPTDPPALSLAVRIDDVCNRFEKAWKAGAPRIDDFVEGWHGEERAALLRELALLDQDYRRKRGEAVPAEDYSARFPELTGPWQSEDQARSLAELVVAEYEIHEERGRGGMGVVYRATDLSLGREVAIKVLQERFDPRCETARRFLAEARITAQLQHPGIPAVHRVGTLPDGRPFLAMKLIKGRTLEVKLKEDRQEGLLAEFEHVCQAVAYAHDHKVIHRDLKPSNVMVGAFGEVQVMDWGLAKILSDGPTPAVEEAAPAAPAKTVITPSPDSDGSETQAGSMIGTPAFMPPEQAGGETDKVDQRADVFGLGAILAVILTGKPPYVGESDQSVRLMAVRGQLGDCLARLDACGAEPEWVALCKRCLAFAPADRPKDAGEVAAEVARLRAAAEERARAAHVEAARAATRADEQQRKRRWQASTAVAVVLALLAAVAGLAVFLRVRMKANAELVQERNRERLAVTTQVAERIESNLNQLEPVGWSLANLAKNQKIDEPFLIEWMHEMVERDKRIYGLTVAFEPGEAFRTPHLPAALLGLLAGPRGGCLAAAVAVYQANVAGYCLYVYRGRSKDSPDVEVIQPMYLHPQYPYQKRSWYAQPMRQNRAMWSPAEFCLQEYQLDVVLFAYLVPIRRQGRVVGVATVDVDLNDFFGKTNALGNWREQISPEHLQKSTWAVFSHTVSLWNPNKPLTDEQRGRGAPGWDKEPETGIILNHHKHKFPLRLKDLPDRSADFDDLIGRIMRRDSEGRIVEPTGIDTATDPDSKKRSTYYFARVPSVEWTLMMAVEGADDTP